MFSIKHVFEKVPNEPTGSYVRHIRENTFLEKKINDVKYKIKNLEQAVILIQLCSLN